MIESWAAELRSGIRLHVGSLIQTGKRIPNARHSWLQICGRICLSPATSQVDYSACAQGCRETWGNRTFRAGWCAVSQKTKSRQALETVVCSESKQVRKPLIHYGSLRVVVPICTKSTITPCCAIRLRNSVHRPRRAKNSSWWTWRASRARLCTDARRSGREHHLPGRGGRDCAAWLPAARGIGTRWPCGRDTSPVLRARGARPQPLRKDRSRGSAVAAAAQRGDY